MYFIQDKYNFLENARAKSKENIYRKNTYVNDSKSS